MCDALCAVDKRDWRTYVSRESRECEIEMALLYRVCNYKCFLINHAETDITMIVAIPKTWRIGEEVTKLQHRIIHVDIYTVYYFTSLLLSQFNLSDFAMSVNWRASIGQFKTIIYMYVYNSESNDYYITHALYFLSLRYVVYSYDFLFRAHSMLEGL